MDFITTGIIGVVVAAALAFLLTGLKLIGDGEIGILTRKIGMPMPQGRIIARAGGQVGVQAKTLMPGLYWRMPIIWRITKVKITAIDQGKIGTIESIDGEPIPQGRLLGDEIASNSYQDAQMFLDNGGKKGPQIGILMPGEYRINTKIFKVSIRDAVNILQENIGVVVASDGLPLPSGYLVAPKPLEEPTKDWPKARSHRFFQNGQAFIDSQGYRGGQLDTLQPGIYYINPLLFEVRTVNIAEVPPGYVAILRSNVGLEVERAARTDHPKDDAKPDLDQTIHEDAESLLIFDKNERGIWREAVPPGKYNLNPLAFTPYLVPTSAVTIDWAASTEDRVRREVSANENVSVQQQQLGYSAGVGAAGVAKLTDGTPRSGNYQSLATGAYGAVAAKGQSTNVNVAETLVTRDSRISEASAEFFKFSQLLVTSMDGFQLEVDVRMIIRIRPQNAAFIIARFGSVRNLIEQIVHPMIDSSFRNKAGEKKAIEFIQARTQLQQDALEKAQKEFEHYHVEAQNLLIAYIKVDDALLATQTDKEIAIQQQLQFEEQAKANEKNIEVQSKAASASLQPQVVSAKLSIQIEQDKADALRMQAAGVRDATKTKADGEAYQAKQVGLATADAYTAQRDALGADLAAFIRVMQEVREGQIKITPDILVTGEQASTGLFNMFLASMVKKQEPGMSQPQAQPTQPQAQAIQVAQSTLPSQPSPSDTPKATTPMQSSSDKKKTQLTQ